MATNARRWKGMIGMQLLLLTLRRCLTGGVLLPSDLGDLGDDNGELINLALEFILSDRAELQEKLLPNFEISLWRELSGRGFPEAVLSDLLFRDGSGAY